MPQRKKRKTSKKRRPKTQKRRFFSPRLFFLIVALIGTTAALFVVLRMPPNAKSGDPSASVPVVRQKKNAPARVNQNAKKTRQYEEQRLVALEQKTREIDLALLQALVTSGIGSKAIVRQDVELRHREGTPYPYQNLVLDVAGSGAGFLTQLQTELNAWVDAVTLEQVDSAGRAWRISAMGVVTHRILLNGSTVRGHDLPPRHAKAGLVIIIDDLGENLKSAQRLSRLGLPITFSILPASTRTKETVTLARQRGHELLLHLPMQPLGNEYSPGPGALYVGMDAATIRNVLAEDLAQVPGVIGVNNHMGSLFTADEKGMAVVMQELKRRDLFFLDSLTTSQSKAKEQARNHGTTYLQRHIFLDNEQDVEAILFQLKKAENLALREGYAIAIGHPYEATLEALARWKNERNRRVRLIRLADLISPGSTRQTAMKP